MTVLSQCTHLLSGCGPGGLLTGKICLKNLVSFDEQL